MWDCKAREHCVEPTPDIAGTETDVDTCRIQVTVSFSDISGIFQYIRHLMRCMTVKHGPVKCLIQKPCPIFRAIRNYRRK